MEILKTNKFLFIFSSVFIFLNSALLYFNIYYGILIPFILLTVWIGIFKQELLILAVVFFSPLSFLLSEILPNTTVDISIPTEPILAVLVFLFVLKTMTGQGIHKKILIHPVSIAIYINLLWLFITTLSSSLPIVSVKFLIARLWFVVPLYFISAHFFKDSLFIKKYIWAYIIPFLFIIFYTLTNLISVGLFIKNAAHGAMQPFFNDHTSYGAVIAMYIPVITGFIFIIKRKSYVKPTILLILLIFSFALVFSYTRAAWISIIISLFIFIVVYLKIDRRILIFFSILTVSLFFVFQFEITDRLSKNRQDSSQDLSEHVNSISNIATDASNLERINRWNSALKMFEERPLLGFGPGTYTFQYAPYQMSYDKTIISTNFGDGGNAHSEYIGPLAESGILGTLSFIGIIIMTIITGVKVYYNSRKQEYKILSITALLGLISYYIHGFLNNFLDTDKASVPFWGFTAIIVAIDIFHKE